MPKLELRNNQISALKSDVESLSVVRRVSAALELLADGVDEITDNGSTGLDGRAAYGFASVIHSCGAELQKLIVSTDYEIESLRLKKPAAAKKEA